MTSSLLLCSPASPVSGTPTSTNSPGGELTVGPDGTMRLDTKMKKTGKDIFIPLSDNAIAWLPERGDATDNARIFYKLPDQVGNADASFHTLTKKASVSTSTSPST